MQVNLRDTRPRLTELIDNLGKTGPVEITKHGKVVAILMAPGKTVNAIQSALDPPNPQPLKPYQTPSKLVSNTELEQSFTYRPVPKPGAKK